jgi:hypothetical protein
MFIINYSVTNLMNDTQFPDQLSGEEHKRGGYKTFTNTREGMSIIDSLDIKNVQTSEASDDLFIPLREPPPLFNIGTVNSNICSFPPGNL